MKHWMLALFLSINLSGIVAQSVLSISLEKDSIEIGQSIKVYIEIGDIPANTQASISYQNFDSLRSLSEMLPDSIEYFAEIEWLGKYDNGRHKPFFSLAQKSLSLNNTFRDTLNMSFWDQGIYSIPAPLVKGLNILTVESPILLVSFPQEIVNPDTSSMILPIKPIIKENKNWTDYLWLFYLIATALIAYGVYYLFKGRSKQIVWVEPEPVKLPAHLIANERLELLYKNKPWENNKVKEYQTELTFIIREYLENRFHIPALESTTEEIKSELNKINFSSEQISELVQVLQIADLVKFAKATPPEDLHFSFLQKADQFVQNTKKSMSVEEEQEAVKNYKDYLKALKNYKMNTA